MTVTICYRLSSDTFPCIAHAKVNGRDFTTVGNTFAEAKCDLLSQIQTYQRRQEHLAVPPPETVEIE